MNKDFLETKTNFGCNVLHLACWKNYNLDIIQFIFDAFKNDRVFLRSKTNNGFHILHLACGYNTNLDIIQFIYNEFKTDKVFLESEDNLGRTAMAFLSDSKRDLLIL